MLKRIGIVAASAMMAFVLAAPALPPAPVAGVGALPLLPIACTFVLPMLQSAKLRRALTGPEISATTLVCFTGPLGYYIATENGWIGPDFFHPAVTE